MSDHLQHCNKDADFENCQCAEEQLQAADLLAKAVEKHLMENCDNYGGTDDAVMKALNNYFNAQR